jgi:hypothetical protein
VVIDNRAHRRVPAHLDGRLLSLDGRCNRRCTILDVSEGGARISGPDLQLIPGRAFLFVAKTGDIFECDIRWTRGEEIGLHFIDSATRSQRKALLSLCELEPAR